MPQSRQLAAIMFTDIVGYTALMGEDANRALQLLQKSKEIQKPLVEKYRGQWLKEMGDGVLARFSTATDAVACALEIQRASRADFEATYRIGIHLGDITQENDDVFGDGVNVASRLEAISDPGGIYISESIEKAIRGQMKMDLKFLGEKQLKNVDYGVRTYAVQGVGLPIPGSEQQTVKKGQNASTDGKFKWFAVVAGGLLILSWLIYLLKPVSSNTKETTEGATHLQIALPDDIYLASETDYPVLDISPDGSTVVFVGVKSGRRDLYVKNLNKSDIDIMSGTEDALHPFFSTDGAWIGFVRGTTLMKTPASGGVPIAVHEITPMSVNRGLAWYHQDSIVQTPSPDGGLLIGSVAGNTLRTLTDWKPLLLSEPYYWPHEVDEVNGVLFTDFRSSMAEEQHITLYLSDTKETRQLINGGTFPKYAGSHIFFTRNASLFNAYFDIKKKSTGDPKLIVESLHTNFNGSALYAVGGNNLVYVEEPKEPGEDRLVWVDMAGNTEAIYDNGKDFDYPKISPSGDRIALTVFNGPNSDLWIYQLDRNTLTRFTSHPGEDFGATWHPNGQLLAFSSEIAQSDGEEGPGIALLEVGSNSPPKRYLPSPGFGYWEFPLSWSPDGKHLMFAATHGSPKHILEVMNHEKQDRTTWLTSDNRQGGAKFSPNGKWVAYISDMSGRDEVYIRSFQSGGPTVQVSAEGGTEPVWSPNGKEIFYRIYDKMMKVAVTSEDPLQLTKPEMLFEKSFKRVDYGGLQANYDISPDGERFVMIQNTSESKPRVINVILNWDLL